MKKNKIIGIIIFVVILALFIPIPGSVYKDGGTKDYRAVMYRVVVWNRVASELGVDEIISDSGSKMVVAEMGSEPYQKTSIYWFPDSFKSIDDLWIMEWEERSQP